VLVFSKTTRAREQENKGEISMAKELLGTVGTPSKTYTNTKTGTAKSPYLTDVGSRPSDPGLTVSIPEKEMQHPASGGTTVSDLEKQKQAQAAADAAAAKAKADAEAAAREAANQPQNRSYSYMDMANQLLDKRAAGSQAEKQAWETTMSDYLSKFSNTSNLMTPEQQGYANSVKATISAGGPSLDPSMTWAEGQTLARSRYNPLYEQDLNNQLNAINKGAVKSGFFGQLPTEQLKQNATASVEADKNAKIFDLAQNLMKDSEDSAYKKYGVEYQAYQDQIDNVLDLWGAVSADINSGRNYKLSVAELTGVIDGVKTLAGRAQDNADKESAAKLKQMAAELKQTVANTKLTDAQRKKLNLEIAQLEDKLKAASGGSGGSGSKSSGSKSSGTSSNEEDEPKTPVSDEKYAYGFPSTGSTWATTK
jgi:hypothetical protein